MNFDTITTQFYNAGLHYSAVIQPYALKLFFALFLIDIIVTWIQYSAEGQLDPSFFLGRLLKHVLSGGFVYLMIVNGFSWMYLVIQSFSRIGAAISGLPALSPQSVLQAGLSMANTLLNSPTATGLVSSLELALVEGLLALVVGAAFLIVAVELLLTLVKAYLTTGLGVILLGFGGNRFTASAAEGYFTNVIRIGVRLLFFYAVLAVGMQMVAEWEADLAAACKPVSATLPFWATYGVPPSSIVTTVCSGTISLSGMLDYAALAVVFAVVTVAVPSMAADLVGGTIGLALAHAFEAAYTAQTVTKIVSPITAGLKKVSDGVASIANGRRDSVQNEPGAISNFVANGEHRNAPADAPTKVLNPFTGKPQPYDNGTGSTSGAVPALPSPNGGANGGVPERPDGPQRPGQYTKDIAIDVSNFQNGNGGGPNQS
jgi:type IV secretion system protein TrbL